MSGSFSPDGQWRSVVRQIAQVVDLEQTARQFGALRRVRKIRSAEALLRLALLYGPARQSLREAAGSACDAGIAESFSDKAVLGRLRQMGDWLEHILQALLARIGQDLGGRLDLIDGTLIFSHGPGKPGWRVHALYQPALGRFTDFAVTRRAEAEAASRTRLTQQRTIVFDRGYARVRDIAAVLAADSDMVTRLGWKSLRLCDDQGLPVDIMALLPPEGSEPCEHAVRLAGIDRPLRLVLQPLPPAKAAQQQRRTRRRASKRLQKLDPRTERAASYLILLTSLPAATPTEQVVTIYRHRWQVELGFKRLKSLAGLGRLPASDDRLARTWLLAQLIGAVLAEDLAVRIGGFSPSAVRRG